MAWRQQSLPLDAFGNQTALPRGNGRSYGDVCLNDGAVLIETLGLDRFIHFDRASGVLRCEAGVLLSEILSLVVPSGWFLAVTPGTQFVTVGGAIANDVHGKNHHWAGTFGCHVRAFELLRSSGSRFFCSPGQNRDWFEATIGGLGLTGLITWAELQLKPISSRMITQETIPYSSLREFFCLSSESSKNYEYIVSWVDGSAGRSKIGRGVFFRANSTRGGGDISRKPSRRKFSIPCTPPISLVNRWTLKGLNSFFYHLKAKRRVPTAMDLESFFYPLDAINAWNRVYGPNGFLQYQCVLPLAGGEALVTEILERVHKAGLGSFPSVLKVFGDKVSPGLLSFPRAGVTLALDFPNRGTKTVELLDQLDGVVRAAKGAVYPAKDACMSAESFQCYFPQWKKLEPFIDSRFCSSFWRRVSR